MIKRKAASVTGRYGEISPSDRRVYLFTFVDDATDYSITVKAVFPKPVGPNYLDSGCT